MSRPEDFRRQKDWLIHLEERGYSYIGEKYVCAHCFDDDVIREFISRNLDKAKCDYCDREESVPIAAHIDSVIGLIVEGIESEWGDPNDEGGIWDSDDHDWQPGIVTDSEDLIVYGNIIPTTNEKLLGDIASSLRDRIWCRKSPLLLPHDQALMSAWEAFSYQVKHRTRYVFFRAPDDPYEDFPVSKMLDELGRVITETNLVTTLKPGTKLYRVRVDEDGRKYSTAHDLGPPSIEEAKISNRMSPAGIPMFYGALDKETALKETVEQGQENWAESMATFATLRELRVLDLTHLPEVPSLFDEERRWLRDKIKFLHMFVKDLCQPIERDRREHIEYVPTQVFTEYLRHLYIETDETPSSWMNIGGHRVEPNDNTQDRKVPTLQGLLYPSSRQSKGIACVLFMENEQCCDAFEGNDSDQEKWLLLEAVG